MKPVLSLILTVVGLFVVSMLFFLFLNGMLIPEPPFLVAARGYVGAEQLQGDSTRVDSMRTAAAVEDAAPPAPDAVVPPAVEEPAHVASPGAGAATGPDAQARDADAKARAAAARRARADSLEHARLQRIVRVYEKMKPRQVALILDTMSDRQSVEILANLKETTAAKVMAAMEPKKAARMSRLLLQRSVDDPR